MPIIERLLDWLVKTRAPHQAPKFGLLIDTSDADFNEPVRQALNQLCEARGITCSIDKRCADKIMYPRLQPLRGQRPPGRVAGRGRGAGWGRGAARGQ